MNVNFEAIENAWFKPKKTVLDELEEWLKDIRINNAQIDEWTIMEVQLKIQELKKENENGWYNKMCK